VEERGFVYRGKRKEKEDGEEPYLHAGGRILLALMTNRCVGGKGE